MTHRRTLTLALAALALAAPHVLAQDADESSVRAIVASRTGALPDTLEIVTATEARFPLTARTARCFKVQDTSDGAVHGVFLDEHGREVSIADLELGEEAARASRFGRLDPVLDAVVAAA